MEAAGVVRCSTSLWASPLHMFRKADSSWRPCSDYCHLNSVMVPVPNTYPIPNMMEFVARAAACTIFSKMDLKKYHADTSTLESLRHPQDSHHHTIWPYLEFMRITLEMRNTSNTFQQLLGHILAGLACTFPYLLGRHLQQRGGGELGPPHGGAAPPAVSWPGQQCDVQTIMDNPTLTYSL